jgi:hypothetical protein
MSSSEVIQKYGNRGQQLWDCCDPVVSVQRLMGSTQTNLFPCDSCDPPNEFAFTAVARDIVIPANLNTPVGATEDDFDQTFTLDSVDILLDATDQYFSVSIGAILYSLGILNVVYSGDTVSVPASTAYTILQGNFYTEEALLTTDTLGSFSVTIAITTDEGVYTFVQPYNVVNGFSARTYLIVDTLDSSNFILTSDIGTHDLPAEDIAIGAIDAFLHLKLTAIQTDLEVTSMVFSGDVLNAAPATPFTILEGANDTYDAILDTTTLGSYTATITFETIYGIVVINLPYNIV